MRYIYKITNLINGKCYVGQTKNFEKRIKSHQRTCVNLKYYISNAIYKYGKDNFTYEILLTCEDHLADQLEKENIIKFNSLVPYGYNLISGGNTNKNLSQVTKDKISRANRGKIRTEEHLKKLSIALKGRISPMKGVPNKHKGESLSARAKLNQSEGQKRRWANYSVEKREQISDKRKKYIISEETKRKISNSLKGHVPPNKGKKMSAAACLKMSLSRMGKPAHNKGIPMSEEQKKKISLSKKGHSPSPPNKGKKMSPEAYEKFQRGNRRRHEEAEERKRLKLLNSQ